MYSINCKLTQQPWWWPANEAIVFLGVCVFINTIDDGAKPNKSSLKHTEKTLNTGRLHAGKYLCKNMMAKEGGRCLLEGGVFSETYDISPPLSPPILVAESNQQKRGA